ncbi:hypothetical protein RJ639_025921 [Escallonia herrerae]|uniref:Cytoplasmic tRNA 2-thiolation protein 2 n=1 Tax=Escallonia herrerae TaxID=1293975 RepID=A0AA88S5S2_9ASTE|nr:hypothetical protein RJ639_025921 [Escallonia herrerae]
MSIGINRVALQFVHEIQHKAQKNFDASASRDRSLPVFGVGAAFIDESAICPVSSNEFDEALEDMRLIVTNLAPPRKKFHVVPIESVYSSDCCNGRDRLKELLNAVSDVTGREDLLVHLRMLCLQKIALENGYTKLVFGSCTSRIACHILAATVKSTLFLMPKERRSACCRSNGRPLTCAKKGGFALSREVWESSERLIFDLRILDGCSRAFAKPAFSIAGGQRAAATQYSRSSTLRLLLHQPRGSVSEDLCFAETYPASFVYQRLENWDCSEAVEVVQGWALEVEIMREESTGSPLAWFMPNESPALEEGKWLSAGTALPLVGMLTCHCGVKTSKRFGKFLGYHRMIQGKGNSIFGSLGRGYSLAADIQYVDARWEIPVVLPLRDCLMQELNVLCMLDSLKTVEVFNGSRVGINGLVTSFVKLLQEENPSRECTIARTAGKLTPFHFNKIPEADDCNDHLAIQRRQKKFNLKPNESLPPESFCPICSSPLNNSFTSVSGCENGHRSPEDFIATCCTSCQFQILPSEPSALGHFCSILPQQIVDQAKDGSCGNQRWLREQIKDCLLSDSEDGT